MRPRLLAPGTITAKCKPAGRLGFGFGRRFFLLILLGVLWCVPAFWSNKFFLIMAAWDACVFAAWAVDLWLLPRAGRLTVERSWTGTASLSNNVDIMVQVQNESAVPLACSVLEDVPQSLRNEPAVVEIKIPRRSSASQTYTVRRGYRVDSPLGQYDLLVSAQGKSSSKGEFEGRQWSVVLGQTGVLDGGRAGLRTPRQHQVER